MEGSGPGEFLCLRAETFIEAAVVQAINDDGTVFPHLRVGTFIEATKNRGRREPPSHFPTFGRGLSLRLANVHCHAVVHWRIFPPSDDEAAVGIDIA